MCGIVGFYDKTGWRKPTGQVVLTMLEALGCRGPDSAGIATIGHPVPPIASENWTIQMTGTDLRLLERLEPLGRVVSRGAVGSVHESTGTMEFAFRPAAGVSPCDVESALETRRGGSEILSLGVRLHLVKQVGSPAQLEASYGISRWTGQLAIGHTRMSTESRIDLSHSQPFWVHGVPDMATVHNGHITNYHQLRRRYEQQGIHFYTDNDSEVIGVYLRDRISSGRTLQEAMSDSITDLDGAYNYLVISPEGLGIVRDRFGFKPLVLVETSAFVVAATEEIAVRRAFAGDLVVHEPAPGAALFFPLEDRTQQTFDVEVSA